MTTHTRAKPVPSYRNYPLSGSQVENQACVRRCACVRIILATISVKYNWESGARVRQRAYVDIIRTIIAPSRGWYWHTPILGLPATRVSTPVHKECADNWPAMRKCVRACVRGPENVQRANASVAAATRAQCVHTQWGGIQWSTSVLFRNWLLRINGTRNLKSARTSRRLGERASVNKTIDFRSST